MTAPSDPPPRPLTAEQIQQITARCLALHDQFIVHLKPMKYGFNYLHYCALTHLEKHSAGLSMKQLADCMAFTKSASTAFVDRMERMGLVRRFNSHEDRRKIQVRIEKGGVSMLQRVRQQIVEGFSATLSQLSTEELKIWTVWSTVITEGAHPHRDRSA